MNEVSIRYVDVGEYAVRGPDPASQGLSVELAEDERIVSIETVKDPFGFARARVWIEDVARKVAAP